MSQKGNGEKICVWEENLVFEYTTLMETFALLESIFDKRI